MSKPINIPTNPSKRARSHKLPKSPFSPEDGPYFGFIEILESGDAQWLVSGGRDMYVMVKPSQRLPSLAFVIQKDCITKDITIEITSLPLRRAIHHAILSRLHTQQDVKLDFDTIMMKYDVLKLHLQFLENLSPGDEATAEMRLLVRELLPERALFEGIGLETFHQRGVLNPVHVQDLHQRSITLGLDEVENSFSLGLVPDSVNEDHLTTFNSTFANLARSGNDPALHDLCEPLVRAGNIEFQYNPSLLLEVLNNGHLETYMYILDLVDRTRDWLVDSQNMDLPDITFDPMYIAIRLGHFDVVESFVRDNVVFEGYVCEDGQPIYSHVFTPLFAAVFWDQQDIVRLLLRSSADSRADISSSTDGHAIYLHGYQQAAAFSIADNKQDIMQVLMEYESQIAHKTPQDYLQPAASLETQYRNNVSDLHPVAPTQPKSLMTSGLSTLDTGPARLSIHPASPTINPMALSPAYESPPLQDTSSWSAAEPVPPPQRPNLLSGESQEDVKDGQDDKSAIEKGWHYDRRKRGQDLIQRLERKRLQINELCKEVHIPDLESISAPHMSPETVWAPGIDCFRRIVNNKAPVSLTEVLQCLLVADALISQLPLESHHFEKHFIADFPRWRSILTESEREQFDRIIPAVWHIPNPGNYPLPQSKPDEMFRFQELIQNLVSIEHADEKNSTKERLFGSRLSKLRLRGNHRARRRCATCHATHGTAEAVFRNIGDTLNKLSVNDASPTGDSFDLGDFIYLDKVEVDATTDTPATQDFLNYGPGERWKDVQSPVVLLLASVAFCIVLVASALFQDRLDETFLHVVDGRLSDYGRSCAVVEKFLSVPQSRTSACSHRKELALCDSSNTQYSISAMKAASIRLDQAEFSAHSFSSATSTLYGSLSSPSGSSFLSTSPDITRSSERLVCQSPNCSKSFSSISNRNKHMREGCSYRDKKGYRCRNGNCNRVLSTKWYRNTHEQTRCRFR